MKNERSAISLVQGGRCRHVSSHAGHTAQLLKEKKNACVAAPTHARVAPVDRVALPSEEETHYGRKRIEYTRTATIIKRFA